MFELSLVELVVIALGALLILGPKELPVLFRTLSHWMRQARALSKEIREGFETIAEESGTGELIDDAGRLQKTYDISDFLEEKETGKDE